MDQVDESLDSSHVWYCLLSARQVYKNTQERALLCPLVELVYVLLLHYLADAKLSFLRANKTRDLWVLIDHPHITINTFLIHEEAMEVAVEA